jgi:hypothetical protein
MFYGSALTYLKFRQHSLGLECAELVASHIIIEIWAYSLQARIICVYFGGDMCDVALPFHVSITPATAP